MGKSQVKPKANKAIKAINKNGALLVYPLANKKEPLSLWSALYPRTEMRWDWDIGADSRVADLWYLREQLSRSGEVVYVKWYQGRATFFSKTAFVNLLAYFRSAHLVESVLRHDSRRVLELLINDSPLSTKQLKAGVELQGRLNEPTFNRTMKPLWNYLLVVGYGEFEDSSFPSLGIGATQSLFEDLWSEARGLSHEGALISLEKLWAPTNPFLKFAKKLHSNLDKDSAETYTYNL